MVYGIPLPVVIAGGAALLAILGMGVLLEMLARSIDRMLGANWLSRGLNNIWGGIQGALNTIGGWLDGVAAGIANFIEAVPSLLQTFAEFIAVPLQVHAEWLRYLARTWIPSAVDALWKGVNNVYAWVTGWVTGLINGVYAWTMRLVDLTKAWVSGLVNELYRWISKVAADIYAWAQAGFNGVYRWAMSLADGIKAWVSGLINNVYAWITQQISALRTWVTGIVVTAMSQAINAALDLARRFTDQAIGALVNALAIAAALPLTPAWPRIRDAIDAIAQALPGSLAAVLPKIGSIPRALPRDLAGILAAVGAIAAVGVDWIKECGVPLCRRLGGFGSEIDALQDALLILDLMDVVSDIINDPRGSASDAATAFSSLITEAADGIIDAVRA